MNKLAGSIVALTLSTSFAMADEAVDRNDLISVTGSADTCIISETTGYSTIPVMIPVNDIKTCFDLGSLHRSDDITVMLDSSIVHHFTRRNIGQGLSSNWQYVDITPE